MRFAFIALLLASCVAAQTLSIERIGTDVTARLIKVVAAEVPALDLITRAAAESGVQLRIDPALVDDLSHRTISVSRDSVVFDELMLLAGAKLGVDVRIRKDGCAFAPAPKSREASLAGALEQVDHALVGHADPQLAPPLRYQRAALLLESGAPEAASAFSDFVRDFPGHPATSEARVLALLSATRSGHHAEALGILASIEESAEGIPAIPGAEVLPARVHFAAGNLTEALVRSRKVAAGGRFERDRAVSTLMTAEILQRLGDGPGMLVALRDLPPNFVHAHPDLAPVLSLATGSALQLMHDGHAALVHLRVAFRTVAPEVKPTVGMAIAECFASLGQTLPAWVAVREAEALAKDKVELLRIQARRGELEESFGAIARATETCVGLLKRAPGPFKEADRVLATLARCMVESDRIDDARAALEALADLETYRGWALYELAALERRAGDPERALRALAKLRPKDLEAPGPGPEKVRTLRGELLLQLGDPLQAAEIFRGAKEEAPK